MAAIHSQDPLPSTTSGKSPVSPTEKTEKPKGKKRSADTTFGVDLGDLRKRRKSIPRKVWHHAGDPIQDPSQIPGGWTADEPDLDENDVNGQIERCRERIKEGIMSELFEKRLQRYIKAKETRNKIKDDEPEGLHWEVYQRLDNLKFIKKGFEEKGDPNEQLLNVEALLSSYRSSKLTWTQGLVTYWSRGVQLCEPKKFQGDECEKLGREHGEGFWVEGLHGPCPIDMLAYFRFSEAAYNAQHQHKLTFALRVPGGRGGYRQLEFVDDTGATTMLMYKADLDEIQTIAGRDAVALGPISGRTPNGPITFPTYRLEVNIIDADYEPLLDKWVPLQCLVKDGDQESDGMPRLSGMWMRHMLYTGTCPDNRGLLYVSNSLGGLISEMPVVKAKLAQPPPDVETEQASLSDSPPQVRPASSVVSRMSGIESAWGTAPTPALCYGSVLSRPPLADEEQTESEPSEQS